MNTQAQLQGISFAGMTGMVTSMPPVGRGLKSNFAEYPRRETVIPGLAVTAPRVRTPLVGHFSTIAYADVPESDFCEVYLRWTIHEAY